jgi:hypothetical protein
MDRGLKESIQRRSGRVLTARQFEGARDLSQDLRLPDHKGIQAGRDIEQMPRGLYILEMIQIRLKLVQGHIAHIG